MKMYERRYVHVFLSVMFYSHRIIFSGKAQAQGNFSFKRETKKLKICEKVLKSCHVTIAK